jgi:hypothetical protein
MTEVLVEAVKILVCRVGQDPYPDMVMNDLKSIQAHIGGGLIDVVSLEDGIDLICDDEGLIKKLPVNRVFDFPHYTEPLLIAGDFLIVGVDKEGEIISLTDEQIDRWRSVVASAMTWEQVMAKVAQIHDEKLNGTVGTQRCTLCGSTKMAPEDFKDELSKREAKISGTCQSCQDNLFAEEPEDE